MYLKKFGFFRKNQSNKEIKEINWFDFETKNNYVMSGSLHIFITLFFVKATKIPKIGCEFFISMCSVFACLALLSKKVNTLLRNTSLPKTTKNQVTKMGWEAHYFPFSTQNNLTVNAVLWVPVLILFWSGTHPPSPPDLDWTASPLQFSSFSSCDDFCIVLKAIRLFTSGTSTKGEDLQYKYLENEGSRIGRIC